MLDYSQVKSPCYVLDEKRLRRNMEILSDIQNRTGVKIICALKGYSFWRSFPVIGVIGVIGSARHHGAHTFCLGY